MDDLIRLRDLPGVSRATDLCRSARNFEYPTSSYTAQELSEISVALFGITQIDTYWEGPEAVYNPTTYRYESDAETADEAAEREEYEEQYHATRLGWPDAQPFWEAIGWDITDGTGGELLSAHCFARQIIAVAGELVEDARLTVDGSGVQLQEADEAGLEARLLAQAQAFMKGRPG